VSYVRTSTPESIGLPLGMRSARLTVQPTMSAGFYSLSRASAVWQRRSNRGGPPRRDVGDKGALPAAASDAARSARGGRKLSRRRPGRCHGRCPRRHPGPPPASRPRSAVLWLRTSAALRRDRVRRRSQSRRPRPELARRLDITEGRRVTLAFHGCTDAYRIQAATARRRF
jgi:hypothetical protein